MMMPTVGTTTIMVGFHPENVCCEGCRLCRTDSGYRDRKRCVVTEEIINYPKQRGIRCPLVFEEENDEQSGHV